MMDLFHGIHRKLIERHSIEILQKHDELWQGLDPYRRDVLEGKDVYGYLNALANAQATS